MCLRLRQCFYLSLIVMVVLSQVCSAQSQPGTQTQSSKPAQNAPDSSIATVLGQQTPPPADGAGLYAQYCASCHGPLATSTKLRRNASQIDHAIASIPQMAGINLTAGQMISIAGALALNDPNGISVGRPKVFDNRTLTIMLDNLSESLRNIQFVDQKTLATAFNLLQGYQSRESASSLSISTLPIPGITQDVTSTTGNVTSSGTPLPDTTSKKTSTKSDVFTPQAPSLNPLPTFSGFTPSYGESASDLLSDQVNLTYQIFNLRMILERSLSDRILLHKEGDHTRLNAVLGFNVTIDPPWTASDAVAVVEITLNISNRTEKKEGLSLVSLMPQEKTYNSAAISTKSNAFGGSAVAKIVQVGYSQKKGSQIAYLYRDCDTISYERMSNDPNQIIFGWMFRPVLGRRSVSPGLRQLFAIVALPARDCSEPFPLKASVKTYWKKYDQGTTTSFEKRDAGWFTRLLYDLSLELSKPEIFESRYMNTAQYEDIEVKSTQAYQDALKPEVSSVSWRVVGKRSSLISVKGTGFFSGTQVIINDKIYSTPADGLILKSDQAFDLNTSLDALANGTGAIIGRYDSAVPIITQESPLKGLNVIIGGDAQGSIEALKGAMTKLSTDAVRVNILRDKLGEITESDVNVASASNAFIIRFRRVRGEPGRKVKSLAEQKHVDIRTYSAMDDIIVDIKDALKRFVTQESPLKGLNVIISGDTQESIEALKGALTKLSADGVKVNILSDALEEITESDVNVAPASNALIIRFRGEPGRKVKSLAEQKHVDIRTYSAMDDIIVDIKDALKRLPEPRYNVPTGGIEIVEGGTDPTLRVELGPPAAGNRPLSLYLRYLVDPDNPWACANFPLHQQQEPIVTVNGNVILPPYNYTFAKKKDKDCDLVLLQCLVPESFLSKDGGLLRVTYPFLSNKWTAYTSLANPSAAFEVIRLTGKSISIYKKDKLGFTNDPSKMVQDDSRKDFCWQLFASGEPIKLKTDKCECKQGESCTIALSTNAVGVTLNSDIPDKILLVAPEPNKAVFVLDVPKAVLSEATTPKPIALNQYDSVWIDVAAKDIFIKNKDNETWTLNMEKVVIDKLNLTPQKPELENGNPPKTIHVQITREVTEKPGDVDLDVQDKAGKSLGKARLHIISCQQCNTEKGGKQ